MFLEKLKDLIDEEPDFSKVERTRNPSFSESLRKLPRDFRKIEVISKTGFNR